MAALSIAQLECQDPSLHVSRRCLLVVAKAKLYWLLVDSAFGNRISERSIDCINLVIGQYDRVGAHSWAKNGEGSYRRNRGFLYKIEEERRN